MSYIVNMYDYPVNRYANKFSMSVKADPDGDGHTLGQRIQLARTYSARGTGGARLTQEAFAAAVGLQLGKESVGKVTVSRWERGDTVPNLDSLLAIARAAKVDPGWLAFGAASQAPPPELQPRGYSMDEFIEKMRNDPEFSRLMKERIQRGISWPNSQQSE